MLESVAQDLFSDILADSPLNMIQLSNSTHQIPSAERCEPGSFPLHLADLPNIDVAPSSNIDPQKEVTKWVTNFNEVYSKFTNVKKTHTKFKEQALLLKSRLGDLFLAESYWRDHLCLAWEFHTLHGPKKIVSLLEEMKGCRIKAVAVDNSKQCSSFFS